MVLAYNVPGSDDRLGSRRLPGEAGATDRPIRLPHLEVTGDVCCFLGVPLPPALFGPDHMPLWQACDGGRELGSWPDDQQDIVRRWHSAGMVVAAPPAREAAACDLTVVSPHPDDAQLALGGLLAGFGGQVLDVMTVETWTRRPYYQDRPELAASMLLAEERVACQVLGVDVVMLGHVDAADRPIWRDGFLAANPAGSESALRESDLLANLVADLRTRLGGSGAVLAPLGVGGHVDHLLVREAVLALVADGTVDPRRLSFYEDMPYSVFGDAAAVAMTLAPRVGLGQLRPVGIAGSSAQLAAKREALWAYRLQVLEGVIRRILRHGQTRLPGVSFLENLWVSDASRLPVPVVAGSGEGEVDV